MYAANDCVYNLDVAMERCSLDYLKSNSKMNKTKVITFKTTWFGHYTFFYQKHFFLLQEQVLALYGG